MHLLHLSTVKYPDNSLEVTVRVFNKKTKDYTFYLTSEWALRQFLKHYKQESWCKALNVLKDFNRKEKEDE